MCVIVVCIWVWVCMKCHFSASQGFANFSPVLLSRSQHDIQTEKSSNLSTFFNHVQSSSLSWLWQSRWEETLHTHTHTPIETDCSGENPPPPTQSQGSCGLASQSGCVTDVCSLLILNFSLVNGPYSSTILDLLVNKPCELVTHTHSTQWGDTHTLTHSSGQPAAVLPIKQ